MFKLFKNVEQKCSFITFLIKTSFKYTCFKSLLEIFEIYNCKLLDHKLLALT